MEEKVAVKKYLEDLFRYLDAFEKDSSRFETEAFLQTYNGIFAVFQALRQQRDQAVEVDRYLLDHIKKGPLNSSDLRLLTLQMLVTFFEVEVDIDGQSNKAFTYCRGLRPVKQDVPFFEDHLLPTLFKPGSLHDNFRLNSFLLAELARFMNAYGKPLDPNLTPEAFAAMSQPQKLLQLQRRRLQMGPGLLEDRGSLEFHLSRVQTFDKMIERDELARRYLREWGYLSETSFWARVKEALSEAAGKGKGAFSNWRYLKLVLTQRRPAYLFYGFIIVLFVFLAFWVPNQWMSYQQQRLEQFQQRAIERPLPPGR